MNFEVRLTRVTGVPVGALLTDASAVREALEKARDTSHELDLGDAWGVLHVLLCGEPPISKDVALERGISWNDESLENVLMGGERTPLRDGVGFVRCLRPDDVLKMARKLESLSEKELYERYDPDELSDVLSGWDIEPTAPEWLGREFERLVGFYRTAAAAREPLLIGVW